MSHRIDCQKKCEGFQLIAVMIFLKKIVWASGTQGEDLSSPIKVLCARKEISTSNLLTWLTQKSPILGTNHVKCDVASDGLQANMKNGENIFFPARKLEM